MQQINKTSKTIVTVLAIITLALPTIMDLNHSHATNPAWPPHARFHFWIAYFSLIGVVSLALFLLWGNYKDKGSRISLVVAGLCPILFWGAFYPALLVTSLDSAWPDGTVPFAPIAPQLLMGLAICGLALYAIRLDAKKRNN